MSYFHPDRMPVLPARRRAAARRQLEELVARSARSGRRARRPERRRHPAVIPAIAAFMVLIALGTGAAAVVVFRPVSDHSSMRCYAAPRRSAAYYMTVSRPAHAMTAAAITRAKGICKALFREGFLKAGKKVGPPKRPPSRHRVPPLVVCAGEDGTAAVVPGRNASETCERVDLEAAAGQ